MQQAWGTAHLTGLRQTELGPSDLGGTEDRGRDVTSRAEQDGAWRFLSLRVRMIIGKLRWKRSCLRAY